MDKKYLLVASLLLALGGSGCSRWSVLPSLPTAPASPPPPVMSDVSAPEIMAVPRAARVVEERALVWVYPLHAASPDAMTLLTEKARQVSQGRGGGWVAPPAPVEKLPVPNHGDGGQVLAHAGVGYVVIPHYETGPAGFLTLEMYRPPDPALVWVTSVPLAAEKQVAKAMDHALELLVLQLSRNVRHPTLTVLSPPGESPSPVLSQDNGAIWDVQAGAYLVVENGRDTVKKLQQLGYQPRLDEFRDVMDRLWHVVRIGRYPTRERAMAFKEAFEKRENLPAHVAPANRP